VYDNIFHISLLPSENCNTFVTLFDLCFPCTRFEMVTAVTMSTAVF